MKNYLHIITSAFLGILLLTSVSAFAQEDTNPTAKVQIIHNSADPALAEVDVYLNGNPLLTEFSFRDATAYTEVPAEEEIEVVLTLPDGNIEDGFAYQFTLDEGGNYVIVANGVLDPAEFSDNPDAEATAFDLFVYAMGREAAEDAGEVDVMVFHGATDAPSVDVTPRGSETPLVSEAIYGDFTGYLGLAPDEYTLDILVAGTETVAASFNVDISGLAGGSAIVLASGFYNVSENQYGEQFRLIVALADGTVLTLEPRMASVQVIHNAADPAAETVDVYINGVLTLDDFEFRDATPYVQLPAYLPNFVGIAGAESNDVSETIADFDYQLEESYYTLIANGVLSSEDFADNPDDVSIAFDLVPLTDARSESTEDDEFQFRVFHGASDAPAVDVGVMGSADRLVEGAAYLDASGYIGVPENSYEIGVFAAGAADPVAVFEIDANGLAGNAAVVLASGFLDPSANENGEAFTLIVVLPDGTVVIPPVVTSADSEKLGLPESFELSQNYPNPFNPTTQINFSLPQAAQVTLRVYDMLGRQVATLVNSELSAGVHTASFDASQLASGMYIYRIQAGEFMQTRKMMLVK